MYISLVTVFVFNIKTRSVNFNIEHKIKKFTCEKDTCCPKVFMKDTDPI